MAALASLHHYWDTSAVVPLLVNESDTEKRTEELRNCPEIITWWGTRIECVSALCRRKRESNIDAPTFDQAMARLEVLSGQWHLVAASQRLAFRAERLQRVHPLRAADAVQLAAALLALNEQPQKSIFHTADERLLKAAELEGFIPS